MYVWSNFSLLPHSPEPCARVTTLCAQGKYILCSHLCLRKLCLLRALGSIFIPLSLMRERTWPGFVQSIHPQLRSATSFHLFQGHCGSHITWWWIISGSNSQTCTLLAVHGSDLWSFRIRVFFFCTFNCYGSIYCLGLFEITVVICLHVEVNIYCGYLRHSARQKGHCAGRKSLSAILAYFAFQPKALNERLHDFMVLIWSLVPRLLKRKIT